MKGLTEKWTQSKSLVVKSDKYYDVPSQTRQS